MKEEKEEKYPLLISILRVFVRNKFLIILLIVFIIALYISFFGGKGFFEKQKMLDENKTIQKMITEDSLKSIELNKEIKELKESDEKIERIAREKYNMTKPGEKIFRIKADTVKWQTEEK